MTELLAHIDRLITPKRFGYTWLAGAAIWLGWLLSILGGAGKVDSFGQPIGTDFLQFYAAGTTLSLGESKYLYDMEYQASLEQSIIGPELQSYHAFITPPFLAWAFVPFSRLPYILSFAAWGIINLFLLWLGLYCLNNQNWKIFGLSLTWFPTFATISFGQNSIMSLAIIVFTYVFWNKKRFWLAGLTASLLLYKPQLILGIFFWWLLESRRDWKPLAGLFLGGGILAASSFTFMPEASKAYIEFSQKVLPSLPSWQEFPIWHLHTVRGFLYLLLPNFTVLADWLSISAGLFGLWAFYRFWKQTPAKPTLHFAGAVCLTIWLTPHAMIYDWIILLIPAVVFWQVRKPHIWRPVYALIWLSTFVGSSLTNFQLKVLPFAIQITLPILAFAYYKAYQALVEPE